MPRFNYAEISASCVHLYSISLIVSSLNKLNRGGPPHYLSRVTILAQIASDDVLASLANRSAFTRAVFSRIMRT
jgi:hypothetical protein